MPTDNALEDYRRAIQLLWGERDEPRRGPKPSLSVEQIARAAIAIADVGGLEAVSMQRVAQECGVTTMALYRYVPGKTELIALMLDIGLGAPPRLDAVPGGWRPRLEQWGRQLHTLFEQHPWSLEASAPLRLMGPNELAWFEAAVSALSATDLPATDVIQAVITVLLHVRGMAFYAIGATGRQGLSAGGWREAAFADALRKYGERFPALTAAAADGAFSASAGADGFDSGLCLLLDGIGVRIADQDVSGSQQEKSHP